MLPRRPAAKLRPDRSAAAEAAHHVPGSLAGRALAAVRLAGAGAFRAALTAALGRRVAGVIRFGVRHHSTPRIISRITVKIAETSSEPKQPRRFEKKRNTSVPYPSFAARCAG